MPDGNETVSIHLEYEMAFNVAYDMAFNALNANHVVTSDIERKLASALFYVFMVEAVREPVPKANTQALAQVGLDHFLHLYGSNVERIVVETS